MKSKKKKQSDILLDSYKKFPVFVNFYLNLDNELDEKLFNSLQTLRNIAKKTGEYVYESYEVFPILKSLANPSLVEADIHDEVEYDKNEVNIYDAIYSYLAVFHQIENIKFTLTSQQTFLNIRGEITLLHNVLLGKVNFSEILDADELQMVTDFMITQKWLQYESFEYKPYAYFQYQDFLRALDVLYEYFEPFEFENLEKFREFFSQSTKSSCTLNPPILVTVDYLDVV